MPPKLLATPQNLDLKAGILEKLFKDLKLLKNAFEKIDYFLDRGIPIFVFL